MWIVDCGLKGPIESCCGYNHTGHAASRGGAGKQGLNRNLRILDANYNRAREALRVLEEFARFVLEDASLSLACKGLRHELGQEAARLGPELLAERDTRGDVGASLATDSEYVRADADAVVRAAAKRLTEALRVLEEFSKIDDERAARAAERMRYAAYDLELRFTRLAEARRRLTGVRLYVIITEALCRLDWLAAAESALRGGAEALQLREKTLPDGELLRRARQLTSLCHDRGALLIVNDRPDVAALSGADGVHLGRDDLPAAAARRLLGPGGIVGVSTHSVEQVRAAVEAAPDYVAVGPMFSSATKPQDSIAGPQTLRAAAELTALPLVAIGGITPSNAAAIRSAAPCALCVCSAVISAADPAEVCRQLSNTHPGDTG